MSLRSLQRTHMHAFFLMKYTNNTYWSPAEAAYRVLPRGDWLGVPVGLPDGALVSLAHSSFSRQPSLWLTLLLLSLETWLVSRLWVHLLLRGGLVWIKLTVKFVEKEVLAFFFFFCLLLMICIFFRYKILSFELTVRNKRKQTSVSYGWCLLSLQAHDMGSHILIRCLLVSKWFTMTRFPQQDCLHLSSFLDLFFPRSRAPSP